MAIAVPHHLVDFALLGPTHDRRLLQDSPILGDVWLKFAKNPEKSIELLIEPHWEVPAGKVAAEISAGLNRDNDADLPNIAPLHGVVAAKLYFNELLRVVVPRTSWWHKSSTTRRHAELRQGTSAAGAPAPIERVVNAVINLAIHWDAQREASSSDSGLHALDRFLALAALITWAGKTRPEEKTSEESLGASSGARRAAGSEPPPELKDLTLDVARTLVQTVISEFPAPAPPTLSSADVQKNAKATNIIWQVSLNRTANLALRASVPAVKADAARRLFGVDCSKITWAIIDAGVAGSHPAFRDSNGDSRVKSSFDFTSIRRIISLDNRTEKRAARRADELKNQGLAGDLSVNDAAAMLQALAEDAVEGRPVRWEIVKQFVQIDPRTPPPSDHGTHVGGIIAANRDAALETPGQDPNDVGFGVCPEIKLYDFRVLGAGPKETEFAIIAALQFIRHLNDMTDYMAIHGANLSLSIPHDVRNYACGRTPICLECERLVESGVVVVAAAGNYGYQSFQTTDGSYDGYAAFTVTDPGNAEGVLTVGSTHRSAPHTFGVSYFSSRGPTGDGRAKPDLVAPGERIRGPVQTQDWGDLDGTSMAAPHVSGAAAMLMARYEELIGQPRRVKEILCKSATDLGRERSFQGHGMLDVLRAFQSI